MTEHRCQEARDTRWYLMVDRDHFHVYVGARIPGEGVLRIDWEDDSRLSMRRLPHGFARDNKAILVGTTPTYCKACLVEGMRAQHLQHYQLFSFNCRTVAYLLLVCVLRFDAERIYALYSDDGILCGINSAECVSLNELHHYLNWSETQGRPSPCVLF